MLVINPSAPIETRLELYRSLAIDGASHPDVARVAAFLRAPRPQRELARSALEYVQRSIAFEIDPPGPDLVFSPAETLARRRADCEDLSILLGSIARALGVPFRIVWIDRGETGYRQSHVTTELYVDGGWLYAEPSVPGAALGEEPIAAARRARMTKRMGR